MFKFFFIIILLLIILKNLQIKELFQSEINKQPFYYRSMFNRNFILDTKIKPEKIKKYRADVDCKCKKCGCDFKLLDEPLINNCRCKNNCSC